MNKRLLRKLMSLHNQAANKKLAEIADGFLDEITKSTDNDDIFEKLESLQEFVYVASDQTINICNYIIFNPKPNKAKQIDNKFYPNLTGRSQKDLVLKSLDLLNEIRYLKTTEVLAILLDMTTIEDPDISKKIEELFKNIATYNYHALKQFGVNAQKVVLNFTEENINKLNPNTIRVLFSELLKPSFEGTQMKDEKTFSWLSGPLVVNKELKEIRRKSIDLLFGLFNKFKDLKERKTILQLLDDCLRFPNSGIYKDDFENMVSSDANYLISKYKKIIFKDDGTISIELRLAQEIEGQLNWIIRRPIKKAVESAKKNIALLDKNELYVHYRILATSERDYALDKDYKEVRAERQKKLEKILNTLSDQNIDKYSGIFTQIGKDLDRMEGWEWQGFSTLMTRIAAEKPELAELILEKNDDFLRKFPIEFLGGFRKSRNWKLWDKYSAKTINNGKLDPLVELIMSFDRIDKTEAKECVRDKDLVLLENIIDGKNEFLKYKIPKNPNHSLHVAIIYALIAVYHFNPKKVEKLIIKEIKKNNDFSDMLISQIYIGVIREQVSFKGWSDENIDIILNHLVEIKSLDHDLQGVLAEVAKNRFKKIFLVFQERIEKEVEIKKTNKVRDELDHYEAIPNYIDENLIKMLQEDKSTSEWLESLVMKISPKNYTYSWRVSELTRKIGGDIEKEIIDKLIESKDDQKLEIATQLMREFDSPNIERCFKIIANSSGHKSKVWNSVASRLYTTGVVSGEYGIRDYYIRVIDKIKKIRDEQTDNKNIQKFANNMIKSLEESVKKEEKRVKEELLLRKVEFES